MADRLSQEDYNEVRRRMGMEEIPQAPPPAPPPANKEGWLARFLNIGRKPGDANKRREREAGS